MNGILWNKNVAETYKWNDFLFCNPFKTKLRLACPIYPKWEMTGILQNCFLTLTEIWSKDDNTFKWGEWQIRTKTTIPVKILHKESRGQDIYNNILLYSLTFM